MKLACLFSGGKDSTYALYLTLKEGHEVAYLVSVFPESPESYMFHYPMIEKTIEQAEAIGIKHIIVRTKGEKEKELEDLKNALSRLDVDGVVSGAIASNYQKSRIDRIAKELGIASLAPLWHKDEERLLKEQIDSGFEIIITHVAAQGLDKSWIGRKIDRKALEELKKIREKYQINLSGEGGEFETLVLDCPLFSHPIKAPRKG
jgi:ABC transporter with metal-binding/Fe-S-binding domain ATP-binding protein